MDISYQVEGEDLKLNIKKPLLKYTSGKENSSRSAIRIKRKKSDETKSHSRSASLLRRSKGKFKCSKPSCIVPFSSEKIHSPSSVNMITCLIKKPTQKHRENENSRKMDRKPGATDISTKDITKSDDLSKKRGDTKLESHSDTTSENIYTKQNKFEKKYRNVSVMVKPVTENLFLDNGSKKIKRHNHRHHDTHFCAEQIVQVARMLTDDGFRNKVLKEEHIGKKKHNKNKQESDTVTSDELVGELRSRSDKKTKRTKVFYLKLKSEENGGEDFIDIASKPVEHNKIVEIVEMPISSKDTTNTMKYGVTSTSKDDTVTSSNIVDTTLKLCLRTKSSDSHTCRSKSRRSKNNTDSEKSLLNKAGNESTNIPVIDLNQGVASGYAKELIPVAITSTVISLNESKTLTELNITNVLKPPKTANDNANMPEQDSLDILKGNGKDLHKCTSGMVVNDGKDLHVCRELQRTLKKSIKTVKSCVHESCQSSFTDLEDDYNNVAKYNSGPITLQETSNQDENTLLDRTRLPEGTIIEETPDALFDKAGPSSKYENVSQGINRSRSKVGVLFPASEIAIQKCSKIMQRKTKQFKRGDRVQELKRKDLARSCPTMMASVQNENESLQNMANVIDSQIIEGLPTLDKNDSKFVLIENSSIYSNEEEIRNWSENKDISSDVLSLLCISDRSIVVTGTSINTDTLLMKSPSNQNFNSNKSEPVNNSNTEHDSHRSQIIPKNESSPSLTNEARTNDSFDSPLTNVLVMQCMVPQTLPRPQKISPPNSKRNITHKDALKSILMRKSSGKMLQCDGFSIIVDEDHKNHKCNVVFAPDKTNILSNYKKHDDVGIQVVAVRPSHIELKPVCAFIASPLIEDANIAKPSPMKATPVKLEKQNPPVKEVQKSLKKNKHKRTTFKTNYETRSRPFEIKRRLCKTPRYIDKVIYDLSVYPVSISKNETDEASNRGISFSETFEEPHVKTAKKEGKKKRKTSFGGSNKKDDESKTADLAKDDDDDEDNYYNKIMTPSVDTEYYKLLYAESDDAISDHVVSPPRRHDVSIQINPEESDIIEAPHSVRISREEDQGQSTKFGPGTKNESANNDEDQPPTRARKRRQSAATTEFISHYDFRLEEDNPEEQFLLDYKAPAEETLTSISISETSEDVSRDSVEINIKPVEDNDSLTISISSTKSETLSVRTRESLTPGPDCEKYISRKHIDNISPEKFAECFETGLNNFKDTECCFADSIKLHQNMKLADFFLALGHSADDCYKLAKDVDLCTFLKTALNEALIWGTCLTQSQGNLILRLSDETRCFPHAKQYFLRLVEAIVNHRIENDAILDSFLNLINFMETGELSRKSMEVYEQVDDVLGRKGFDKTSIQIYQTYTMLKKCAVKKINKALTNKEKGLLRDLAQRSAVSPKLKLSHSKMIARYIGTGKITYKFRLKAAMDFMELQNKNEIDIREFERYCGIVTNNAPAPRKNILTGVH